LRERGVVCGLVLDKNRVVVRSIEKRGNLFATIMVRFISMRDTIIPLTVLTVKEKASGFL